MKAARESTLVFISAGTACSQDQDGAVQIGRGKFGLGKSPGNGPVHSFSEWVACSRSARSFLCHASPFTRERTLTGNTHTHVHKKYVREKDSVFHSLRAFLSANMKMFSLWKPPIGSPQKFSSNWKPDWQTLWTIDRKTSRRRLRGSEIQRGIMFGGAIEG